MTPEIAAAVRSIDDYAGAAGDPSVGELGTVGATPSVVNAVADALARNGMADRTERLQMPLTPCRVWELLQQPAAACN